MVRLDDGTAGQTGYNIIVKTALMQLIDELIATLYHIRKSSTSNL